MTIIQYLMKIFVLHIDPHLNRQAQKARRDAFLIFVSQLYFPNRTFVPTDFKVDALGKPFLQDVFLPFSISKIQGAIAILASRHYSYLGVDLIADQQISFVTDLDIYTENEQASLKNQPDLYPCMYAKKEALLKAAGCGFRFEPKLVDVQNDFLHFLGQDFFLHAFHSDVLKATLAVCTNRHFQIAQTDLHLYTIENETIVPL